MVVRGRCVVFWVLGGVMPVSVGILEDIGLIVSGVVITAMIVYRDTRSDR